MTKTMTRNEVIGNIKGWENLKGIATSEFDRKMKPLRQARRNGEKVDWKQWDELTNEVNQKHYEYDYYIIQLKRML